MSKKHYIPTPPYATCQTQATVQKKDLLQKELVRLENMLQDLMQIICEYDHLWVAKSSTESIERIISRIQLTQKMIYNQLQEVGNELKNDEIWSKFLVIFQNYCYRFQDKLKSGSAIKFLFQMRQNIEHRHNPFQGKTVIKGPPKVGEAACMVGVGKLMRGFDEVDRADQIYKKTKAARIFDESAAYHDARMKVLKEKERAHLGLPTESEELQRAIEESIKLGKPGHF